MQEENSKLFIPNNQKLGAGLTIQRHWRLHRLGSIGPEHNGLQQELEIQTPCWIFHSLVFKFRVFVNF